MEPRSGVPASQANIGTLPASCPDRGHVALCDVALGDLYRAHAPGLVRWMRARTRDEELAADLVQEAFLRLAREAREGRMPDNPPAWLAQVARNLCTSGARRRATATRFEPLLERPRGEDDPAALALDAERAAAVHEALAGMRVVDRTALILAAEGHRNAEIAAHIGRTELATRALLHRARRRLRPGLSRYAATA